MKDVCLKASVYYSQGTGFSSRQKLIGITSVDAASELAPVSGNSITYFEGYDESIFTSNKAVCLVSTAAAEELSQDTDNSGNVILTVQMSPAATGEASTQISLEIAGTYSSKSQTIYCPFSCVAAVQTELDGKITGDSLSATVRDNHELDEFRQILIRHFANVDPSGHQEEINNSPALRYQQFAITVHDETLRETLNALNRNLQTLYRLKPIFACIEVMIGAAAGFFYIHIRRREFAIARSLGTKRIETVIMVFVEIFNEWYAAQTSKKIRAVWKNKAANGKRVSSSVPFGYVKNPQDKEDWLVDEPAADIVRKIYALCLDGRGPLQIAKQLEQEKVLIPSAYYASLGRKTRKQYTHPYAWDQKTVAGILANQQYTGCTVNFMTTTVSYKVHKTVYKPKDEWQIIPNTQPAIIDEDTWKRVQELRENRIRPTATGRTSLFSGKVFCADCGSKLHFCAAKSLNANQEHYRCANYKSGRGNCQIHYIRNVVLEKIVLEAINSLADFVRCYEPVFLYLMAQKDIVSKRTETNRLKTSIESGKRRIQDLDKLIERIYEDQVLGNISAERYARMSVNYENEQRELVKRVDEDEKRLACIVQ